MKDKNLTETWFISWGKEGTQRRCRWKIGVFLREDYGSKPAFRFRTGLNADLDPAF
jgi:hypothetical protein